jgi:hypothetical protein
MNSEEEDLDFDRAPVLSGFNMDYLNQIAIGKILCVFPIKARNGSGFYNIYQNSDMHSINVALIFGTVRMKSGTRYFIQVASNESDAYVKFEEDARDAIEFTNRLISLEEMHNGLTWNILDEVDFDIKYEND